MHRLRSALVPLLALAPALGIGGCVGESPNGAGALGGSSLPDGAPRQDAGDVAAAGGDAASAGWDAESPDAAISDAAAPDGGGPDLPATPACETGSEPGCPCKDNGECDSAFCVPTPDGERCAAPCVDTCLPGYKCAAVSGSGGDVTHVCVSRLATLCNPCTASADCAALGLQGSVCFDRGATGAYCGLKCEVDADCPAGHGCYAGVSVEGQAVKQCQPLGAPGAPLPGACSCTAVAVAAELSTGCHFALKGEDGQVEGVCKGLRRCGTGGLGPCTAQKLDESCNGEDDDCDGATDEGTCGDDNPCTTDACGGAGCQHTPAPGACDADGNLCTENDACEAGTCKPGAVKSCDDKNPCTLDACDPLAGCQQSADDGKPCDDGNGCTVGDVCKGAACHAGAPKACTASVFCKVAACDSATGKCLQSDKKDGEPCDDGSLCTSADACKAGGCQGAAVDCDDKNPCTTDTCEPGKGCGHVANAAPCDDGNACTAPDLCSGGGCAGKLLVAAKHCDDGQVCTTEACDPKTGCVHLANAAPCDDGDACTVGDLCAGKSCEPGTNTCQCQKDADCKDDGDACNGQPFCDKSKSPYMCKTNPATVVTCDGGKDTLCAKAVCQGATGQCALAPAGEGQGCDADGSVCTVGDACKAGKCAAGKAMSCDDGNPCTDDGCDAKKGCTHVANSAACDADGDACTVGDVCVAKVCVGGAPKPCGDGEPCTVDGCVKASGACTHEGAALEGKACDADGSVCTVGDVCKGGKCAPGPAMKCDDKNPCTTDTCAPAAGCLHAKVADKTGCGEGVWCVSGQCVKSASCGDGVVNQPSEQCDDGNKAPGDGCSASCQKEPARLPAVGELVITEIMVNPATTESKGEWFEVYNATKVALKITGLEIRDGFGKEKIAKAGLEVQPGGYFVFGASQDLGGAGAADYTYSYQLSVIALNNNGDEVSVRLGALVIDKVKYGTKGGKGWPPVPDGKSLQLDPGSIDAVKNDAGASWCASTAPAGAKAKGTPGKANTVCK